MLSYIKNTCQALELIGTENGGRSGSATVIPTIKSEHYFGASCRRRDQKINDGVSLGATIVDEA